MVLIKLYVFQHANDDAQWPDVLKGNVGHGGGECRMHWSGDFALWEGPTDKMFLEVAGEEKGGNGRASKDDLTTPVPGCPGGQKQTAHTATQANLFLHILPGIRKEAGWDKLPWET